MNILYERIQCLCSSAGITGGKLCSAVEIQRSLLTDLKMGRKQSLSAPTITKIANFFDIPISFLVDSQPFCGWELIDSNREGFFYYLKEVVDPFLLGLNLGDGSDDPNRIPTLELIRFLGDAVESAVVSEDGAWNITAKSAYAIEQKEKPAQMDELENVYLSFARQAQEEGISPDDIKLAIETIKKLRGE